MLNAWSRDLHGKPLSPPHSRSPGAAYRQQRGPRGGGVVQVQLLPSKRRLQVLPDLPVEHAVEQEDEETLEGGAGWSGPGQAGSEAARVLRLPGRWAQPPAQGRKQHGHAMCCGVPGASLAAGARGTLLAQGRGDRAASMPGPRGGPVPATPPGHLCLQHDITCWEALSVSCKWPTPSPRTRVGCTLPRGGRMSPGTGSARDSVPGVPGRALGRAALWTPGSLLPTLRREASREPPAHSGHTVTTMPWPICPRTPVPGSPPDLSDRR